MKEIIVSGLEESAVERLQQRADAHGWSLEEEIRHILTRGVDALEFAQAGFSAIKSKTAEAAEAAGAAQVAARSRRANLNCAPSD